MKHFGGIQTVMHAEASQSQIMRYKNDKNDIIQRSFIQITSLLRYMDVCNMQMNNL